MNSIVKRSSAWWRAVFLTPRSITPAQSAYLGAWRGLAAIVVLVGHLVQNFFTDGTHLFGAAAQGSVMVFFGISGFFIHKSLASNFVRGHPSRFVISRINRLLPPFVFSLLLVTLLWAVAPYCFPSGTHFIGKDGIRPSFSLAGMLPTALFLNGFAGQTLDSNGALWSLSFEVWYYAGLFMLGLITTGNRLGLIAIPVLATLALRNLNFVMLGLVWTSGVLISIAHARDALPKIPRIIRAGLGTALAAVLCWFCYDPLANYALLIWRLTAGLWFVAHMSYVLGRSRTVAPSKLSSTARFSYTLYVTHWPILLFAFAVFRGSPIAGVLTTVGIVLLAVTVGARIERWRPLNE